MTWPFGTLRPLSYDVIMVDPPWSFDNWSIGGNAKNAKAKYACMPLAEIAALPVGHLARGDAWLWLQPLVLAPEGLARLHDVRVVDDDAAERYALAGV